MIKAIIFDCFGVLATDGWLPFKQKYFGHNPELFKEAGELNRQVDAGLVTQGDRTSWVARKTGLSEEEVWQQLHHNVPNGELFSYISKRLKPNYKIGMLSNVGGDYLSEIFSKKYIDLFDAIALSYETGITKPDPRAYGSIIDRLNVKIEDCVFVDDQERYCDAAQVVGMGAVLYKNFDQMKRELEESLL